MVIFMYRVSLPLSFSTSGSPHVRAYMSFYNYQRISVKSQPSFYSLQGVLKNGNTVAVKKLIIGESRMAKASFESEVKLISNVHHRNLIRLLGCCNKGPELILVYEYMANSSLDKFLFGKILIF